MSPDKMEDSSTLSKVCSIFADNGIIMYDYMRKKPLIKAQIVPVVLLEKYSSSNKTKQPKTGITTLKTSPPLSPKKKEKNPLTTLSPL